MSYALCIDQKCDLKQSTLKLNVTGFKIFKINTYIQFICIALDNTDIVIPTALDIDLQLKFLQLRLIYYTVRIIKSRKFKYREKSEIEKFLKHF